ncbi:DJ-1/PfpI family protein [Pseudomonas coleopterorum]|uniref:DJ-1/PfpI family protein n=1 Tax=Pseudomonas coleopterorum TaxID=1605838 RepID=A0ABR9BS78_9PSED|nr:DJ-1/PfpI family protein [Pseudomonas coleopterorum]MBD8754999.1 DJ-1/PfpI family protein [Pseudomonas coleopterorum]MBD8768005.1 DJ-1/PfpI family protein [Pseudomonas coleopterorum]
MPNALPPELQIFDRPLHVVILLYPGIEILDFAGPYEVFSVATRIALRDGLSAHPPFLVSTVAANRGLLAARYDLRVQPDAQFDDELPCDVLIVPGGVIDQPVNDPDTLDWIRRMASRTGLLTSVCSGALILAKAGLLQGHSVTTHWADIQELREGYPDLDVQEDVPYVDAGSLVTSAGISAGIDMSLHLVARLLGDDAARITARQMQYEWRDLPG